MKPKTNNKRTLICPRTMEPAPNLGIIDNENLNPLPSLHVNERCQIKSPNLNIKFTQTYEPEIKINPQIPESITIEGQLKCPKCGFPVTDKISYMVAGGSSRSKNHCNICGYNF